MSRVGTDPHFEVKGTTFYRNVGNVLTGYKASYSNNTCVLSHSLRNSNLSLFKLIEYFIDK